MSIMSFLSAALPASLAAKLLSKVNPKVAEFVTNSFAAGYGADQVVGFLRDKVTNPEREKLEKSNSLRPDEKVSLQRIKGRETPADIAQTAAGIGGGVLGGLLGMETPAQSSQQAKQSPPLPMAPQQPRQPSPTQKPPTLTQKVIGDVEKIMDQDRSQRESFGSFLNQWPELKKNVESGVQEGIPAKLIYEQLKQNKLSPSIMRRAEQKFGKSFDKLIADEYAMQEEARDDAVINLFQDAIELKKRKLGK